MDVVAEGGNPFSSYPNPNTADILGIQATFHIPEPKFGSRDALGTYEPITAYHFDASTKRLVAQLEFRPGDGTLIGGSRYKPLPQNIVLPPGFRGVMTASGYNAQEPWGDTPAWNTRTGGGRLSLLGTGFDTTVPGGFPGNVVGNPSPIPYSAGTFLS